ncbi:MAG TPA: tetraacyldisaccharide 4'-kinase, partial [Thermohalobaculum sp.]|nr:tetraacyldisaccharide 4'-kinase [Thermohalobaculum sp.]
RTAARIARARPLRAGIPVVCVGNLTAGGAGKTPVSAWLAARLEAQGLSPHILSRGHGGRREGPHRVDPVGDTAREVGDEPLMLAALAPVWVARDRVAGARAAAAAGAGVVIMDDGFQNPGLAKDVSLLVVDAGQGFGNGRTIPAGPLREPVAAGLARADAVVLIGEERARERLLDRWPLLRDTEMHLARLAPRRTGLDLAGEPVVAFAGIGRPEKFFETLRGMGAEPVACVAFSDHYVYPPEVLRRLLRQARSQGAMLVTTEKDAVRLPAAFRPEVVVVQVALEPEDPDALARAVLTRLRPAEAQQ